MELKLPSVISLKANVKAITRQAFPRLNAFYAMAFLPILWVGVSYGKFNL